MKIIISFLLFCSVSQLTLANTTIDSLKLKIEASETQTNSADLFQLYSELTEQYEKQNDTLNTVISSIILADLSRASGSHLIALQILDELVDSGLGIMPKQKIHICLVRGSVLYEISKHQESLFWSYQGIELGEKFKIFEYDALLYNLLGASYLHSNQDSAIKYFNISASKFIGKSDMSGVVLAYINISRLHTDNEEYDKGIQILQKSIEILNENDVPIYRKMVYANLAIIYRNIEDYKKSTKYLNLRDSVNFAINNNNIKFQVSQFQNTLEKEKKTREVLTLKSKIDMIELENQRNGILVTFSLILIFSLGIGLFFVVKNNRHKKEINELISKKAKDLESVNKFKNQILSVISHDMRSPLAQVITFQHAKNSGINFSPDEIREMDKTIMASAKNGLLILDNLLKWASNQFSGEELKIENFNGKFVITQILNQVSELAKEKEITIHSDIPNVEIDSNESLFQIIIRNLISNAIKFSPLHSEIRISSVVSQGFLVISIIDQGPGIPPKILAAIQDGQNVRPKIGSFGEKGAGIGLSFSKDFASRIGGEITFSKDLLIGTEAIFKVPLGKVI